MPCTRCAENPNFHSFKKVGHTTNGLAVFYSKPSLGIERRLTEQTMPNYLAHLEEASQEGPWVWVFDSGGLDNLEMPKPRLMKEFYFEIQRRVGPTLRKAYILNIHWKVALLLSIIRPFLRAEARDKLMVCDTILPLLEAGINVGGTCS